jgi:hypothetical protein
MRTGISSPSSAVRASTRQFDEPVGIAIDKNGVVYVAIPGTSAFKFPAGGYENILTFIPDKQWDVYGWFGQSLDNKPFIAVDDNLHVFITDPEGYRVMEFDREGRSSAPGAITAIPARTLGWLPASQWMRMGASGSQTACSTAS